MPVDDSIEAARTSAEATIAGIKTDLAEALGI